MAMRIISSGSILAVSLVLAACGDMSSTVDSSRTPCRDQPRPASGSLHVRYSDPSRFDTVVISLDPRDNRSVPYSWSPARGTQTDEVKGLSFVKYWIVARYVRDGDTVDVFESETIEDGKSTNDAGCTVYNTQSGIDVRVLKWPN